MKIENLQRAIEINNYLKQVEALLIKVEFIHNPNLITVNENLQCTYTLEVIPLDGYDDERRKFIEDIHIALIDFLHQEKDKILNEFKTL